MIATARHLSKLDVLQSSARLYRMQLDVTDGEDILKEKLDEAAQVWGCIDVLVNNAGIAISGLIEESGSVEEFFCRNSLNLIGSNILRSSQLKNQFRTNVFGVLDVTTAALPHMRKRKSGTIVIIGSRMSWNPSLCVSTLVSASGLISYHL